ncbi:MAG TPA: MarR family winged helix-turn-helix transcriptional regulator, partial [Euzebya sp.]|nr:MarR family winged helix-turn-helix transcriptional regulator [Euzebya sp.]
QDLGPQCQQDLCDRLDLDKSHMVGFVDDLEGMGHVVRTRDVEDRRRHRVQLTPSGRGLLVQLFAVEARCQDALFGVLQPADRQHLVDLLRTVVEAADGNRLGARQVRACEPAPGPAAAPAASPAVTAVTAAGPAVTPAEVKA